MTTTETTTPPPFKAPLPIFTHVHALIEGELLAVRIVAAHVEQGYRVTNMQWGGDTDTWIPFGAARL